MNLTGEERALLDGADGPGIARAMEILVALGQVFDAPRMVPVLNAQISGISFKNIGQSGLDFLADWADLGARVQVPAYMNPGGVDRELWEDLGISQEFADKQFRVVSTLERMGVTPFLSCTPYHGLTGPEPGQHLAWSESSAVIYANSVLGARTNREGGPSALAAAIAGRTPAYGLHTDAGRLACLRARVKVKNLRDISQFGALGYLAGQRAGSRVVLFENLALPGNQAKRTWALKSLGSAMAAAGAVGLFHIAGMTPEARDPNHLPLAPDAEYIEIDDLEPAYAALGGRSAGEVDLVFIGCPHLSRGELQLLIEALRGRVVKTRLFLTSSQIVRAWARETGALDELFEMGVRLLADTCVVVAPLAEMNIRSVATNSAKAAVYIPSHHGIPVFLGTLDQCLTAAETGQWTS